jgi:hypothetical protein
MYPLSSRADVYAFFISSLPIHVIELQVHLLKTYIFQFHVSFAKDLTQ